MEIGEEKLDHDIEASERTVIQILESDTFVLWFGNVANFLTIFDSLTSKIKDRIAENNPKEDNKDELFAEITDGLKTTMGQVKLGAVNTRYSDDERVIGSSMQSLKGLMEVGDSELLMEEFLSEAEGLRGSLNHLMSGLLGELILGGDILFNIRDAVQCDEIQFREQAKTYLDLLAAGIKAHANYIILKKISPEDNAPFRKNMEKKVGSIMQRVVSISESCREQVSETTDEEMERILRRWTTKDQQREKSDNCDWMTPLYDRFEKNCSFIDFDIYGSPDDGT